MLLFIFIGLQENINMLEDSINRMYGDEPMKKVSTVFEDNGSSLCLHFFHLLARKPN